MTNSADSRPSRRARGSGEIALVATGLVALAALAVLVCFRSGWVLYYGDAQAHLNISRSIIDSKTPGYDQLGTVWLPLLHALCLPFVGNNFLWSTGLAGSIPVAVCFVVAGTAFYAAACDAYGSRMAASVVVACFALNPNLLYLAAIPMTEVVFLAGLAVFLFALFRFRKTQRTWLVAMGVAASSAMSLTRYDGWFLIPFAALFFAWFARRERIWVFALFGAAAAIAPCYWMAHNWYETSNALDFINGPYSASAIQGDKWYPGYHNWTTALVYYATAGQLCAGSALVILGAVGVACAAAKRVIAPVLFLLLTPVFYVWSIHSSKTPIFVPPLWPHGYYNSRYGIAVVVLAAFAAGAIVLAIPERWRKLSLALPLVAILPWLTHPKPQDWICWKESQVNSDARRAWTGAAADYLRENRHPGETVMASFGDLTGIFCRASMPLRDVLHEGNGPAWVAAVSRPDLYHPASWAIAQQRAGDRVWQALSARNGGTYGLVREIRVPGAPPILIYRRREPTMNIPEHP